jgi:excisionase family DNA binding protein
MWHAVQQEDKYMELLERPIQGLSRKDIVFARESAKLARRQRKSLSLQINGITVPAGSYLNKVVQASLELIAEGHLVAVMPVDDEIGTQEAADILKVSRPYLVKLLDAKAIPSRKVGVQRRLRIEDVLAYKETETASRKRVLEELAAEGQRLHLGE